jgi:hypothetical protein
MVSNWCDDERDIRSAYYSNTNTGQDATICSTAVLAKQIAQAENTAKTGMGYNESIYVEYKYEGTAKNYTNALYGNGNGDVDADADADHADDVTTAVNVIEELSDTLHDEHEHEHEPTQVNEMLLQGNKFADV